jgi:uncharacterized glyoxalase superfamily protein PhnB
MPELDLEQALRDLPRPTFKTRLRATLQPQTVTPYITVRHVDDVIGFAEAVLGAEELLRTTGPAGGTHCEVRIRDSRLMIGGGEYLGDRVMPTMLHVYVRDVDAMYQRAVEFGAKSLGPPRDQEYGDRDCVVEDLAGNQWCLATSMSASYKPESLRAVTMYLHPYGVDKLIAFTEQAFGAQTLERHEGPEGTVVHAKAQIGNSVIEMGEAHGQWQPMPTMIYVAVDDADAGYERAVNAGGKSIMPPVDQPYGARMAAIEDPAGNHWYLAAPLR